MPTEDTGWKVPQIVQTEKGEIAGLIQPATGIEAKPCFTCRSWEKDTRKLMQHFTSHGLTPDAEGYYETPIAKEINGRKSLRIHPRDNGFCNKQCCVSHMNATCPDWTPTRFASELALKVR
jgi:hypothetical protein